MIYLRIKFEEEAIVKYKGVEIIADRFKDDKIFNTNDFVKDWYSAIKYIVKNMEPSQIFYANSVDNFIELTKKYDSAFLVDEGLVYQIEFYMPHLKFFVPTGHKFSWEQFKTFCL